VPEWVQVSPWAAAAVAVLLAVLGLARKIGRMDEKVAQMEKQVSWLQTAAFDLKGSRPAPPPEVIPPPMSEAKPVEVRETLALEDKAIIGANELLAAGKLNDAGAAFRELYRKYPTRLDIAVPLLELLIGSESKHAEVLDIIEAINAVHQLPSSIKRLKIIATRTVKGNAAALEIALQSLKEEPGDPALYISLSAMYYVVGKIGQAIDVSETGLKIAEDLKSRGKNGDLGITVKKLKVNLAYFYSDLWHSQYKDIARRYAEEAYEKFENSNTTDTLGYVYITYGDTKEEIYKGIDLCKKANKMSSPRNYLERALQRATERLAAMD